MSIVSQPITSTLSAVITGVFSGGFGSRKLRAISGFTDGPNCTGLGNLPINFNRPVAFTDHTGVTITNLTTLESMPITSATVSPASTIVYDDNWITPPVSLDQIEYEILSSSGYTDETGNRSVYNFTNTTDTVNFPKIALSGDYTISGDFYFSGIAPTNTYSILGVRSVSGGNPDPSAFVLYITPSVASQLIFQIPVVAGFENLVVSSAMVVGKNSFTFSAVAGTYKLTLNGISNSIVPTSPTGIEIDRIGERAGVAEFVGYISNINIDNQRLYKVNDGPGNAIIDSIGAQNGFIENENIANWSTESIGAYVQPQKLTMTNCLNPPNSNIQGTLLEDFESIGQWTNPDANASTFVINTTEFKTGTQSLKLGSDATAQGRRYKYYSGGSDWSEGEYFDLWVRFDPLNGPTPQVTMTVASQIDAAGNFTGAVALTLGGSLTGTPRSGEQHWRFKKSDFAAANWATVYNFMLQITPSAGTSQEISFDAFYTGNRKAPIVVFTLDDGSQNQYDAYIDTFLPKNIPVTMYINGSLINTTGVTTADLLFLISQGSETANHTYNHVELTTLPDQAAVEAEIQLNIDFMLQEGISGELDFAYPNGSFNDTVISACKNLGLNYARSLRNATGQITALAYEEDTIGISNIFTINSINLNNETSLQQAKDNVDEIIARGGTLIFYAHLFGTVVNSSTWLKTDLSLLLDHVNLRISQGVLTNSNFGDWFNNQ